MIQSIASRSLPDAHILFQEYGYTVTPSWLETDRNSYAVHTITRLTLRQARKSHVPLVLSGLGSMVMMAWLVWRLIYAALPEPLFWPLFVLGLSVGLYALYLHFRQLPRYRLDIHFSEIKPLVIAHKNKDVIQRLHEALALAMDWHRGDAVRSVASSPASSTANS